MHSGGGGGGGVVTQGFRLSLSSTHLFAAQDSQRSRAGLRYNPASNREQEMKAIKEILKVGGGGLTCPIRARILSRICGRRGWHPCEKKLSQESLRIHPHSKMSSTGLQRAGEGVP